MNAALELLGISSQNRRYAFTYVDSIGVIERHRFVDVSQEAARWAHLVQRNGLEPGACVLVLAGRDRHWRSALLGVVEAGGIAMPCPASTPVAEIRSLAAASRRGRRPIRLPATGRRRVGGDDHPLRGRLGVPPDGMGARRGCLPNEPATTSR